MRKGDLIWFRDGEWHRLEAAADMLSPEGANGDVVVPRAVVAPKAATAGSWTKGTAPKGGKPPGTLNRITRTMKAAAVEAAHELGQVPVKHWAQAAERRPERPEGLFQIPGSQASRKALPSSCRGSCRCMSPQVTASCRST